MKLLVSEIQKRPQRGLGPQNKIQNDTKRLGPLGSWTPWTWMTSDDLCDATRRPRRRRTTPWLRRDRRDGFTPDVKGLLKGLEEMSGALRPSQSKANC